MFDIRPIDKEIERERELGGEINKQQKNINGWREGQKGDIVKGREKESKKCNFILLSQIFFLSQHEKRSLRFLSKISLKGGGDISWGELVGLGIRCLRLQRSSLFSDL